MWAASASGLTLNALTSEQQAGSPECSTLDGLTVDSPRFATGMDRTSAAAPFWQTLPAPASQETAAQNWLVAATKLIAELGTTSSSVSATAIQALYDNAPADEIACGVSATLPVSATCAAWATDHNLTGKVGVCQRMLSSHVGATVFKDHYNACLDLLADPALAGSDACAIEVRNSVEALEELLFEKSLTFPSAH